MMRASWRSWWDRSGERVGPHWLQYVWTFVFGAIVAVGFTVLGFAMYGSGQSAWRNLSGWWFWYQKNLIIGLCVSFTIHLLFDLGWAVLGAARIGRFKNWQRVLFFAGVPMAGVAVSWPVGLWLAGGNVHQFLSADNANAIAGSVLLSLLMTFLFYQFFAIKARQIKAERAATEARLKLLQAQIEPHFLFNTLANVVGLMEADTPRAKAMLESFIDYLRSSLGSMRREQNTLGDELELVEAYMRIIQIRMEQRLQYRIDVPGELRALPLPALTLQPLVENAIQHGLEPKIEGGYVHIVARRQGNALVLTVADNGLGLGATTRLRTKGTGTAVSNIRERLIESHGSTANLQLASVAPQGVLATLTLPTTA
jgi:signal transduction histidine kinase